MKKLISAIVCCVMALAMAGVSYAAGNAGAGKSKTATCSGCHGGDGNSMVPNYPRLAGQNSSYIRRQLADFKNLKRADPTMQAMVAALSEQDMQDIGAYYASQVAKYTKDEGEQFVDEDEEIPVTAELIARGKEIYEAGNEETGLAACSACHGPTAEGNPSAGFPNLKGQFLVYVIKSLNDFKESYRNNDDAAMMQTLAKKMTKDEIYSVSAYLSSLK